MVSCSVHFTAELEVSDPTAAILMIEALDGGGQVVSDPRLFAPVSVSLDPFRDHYGNLCRRGSLPAGISTIEYFATVDAVQSAGKEIAGDDPNAVSSTESPLRNQVLNLPPDVMHYLLASRYCPADRLEPIAIDLFGRSGSPAARVQTIVHWINEKVRYQYGVSDAGTTAIDTLLSRAGVCRDFSHLAIALCRALLIPARYVSGYCLGLDPPDLHAYFQAFLDGHWHCFDATTSGTRPALIQIGMGRDAADCAWSTFYGSGTTRYMSVVVEPADPATDACTASGTGAP